jgi:glyoxylase-like metal-dependent hydrolase (beta-lactamase superfamily II)
MTTYVLKGEIMYRNWFTNLSVMLTLLILSLGLSGSAFAQGNSYKATKVADGLYSFGDGFTFNVFMITNDGVIVIDPVDKEHATQTLKAIRELTDKPIRYLIYSHNHYDHISGGQVFKDQGATIMSHANTASWLANHRSPDVVIPGKTWKGVRSKIVLGGRTLELHHFGPSHGEGMTVFRFPKEKVVFTADLVVPRRVGFAYMPDFLPKEWERTLAEMDKLEFDTIMFAHKAPSGGRSALTEQREFLKDLRAGVLAELQKGTGFSDIPNAVKLPKYADWSRYKDWLPMNAWRILLEIAMGV